MNAVPFDTLKLAQRLEAAGFSAPQAAGFSEALSEAIGGMELATRSDLGHEIAGVRSEMGTLRSELLAAMELLRRDMTIKLGGMIFIAVGVLLAAMRYMPHP
jgi:hypothetical protein